MNGHFVLRLDDETTVLDGASGGEPFAAIVKNTGGPGSIVKKQLAELQFEDITLEIGIAMQDALFDWIAESWSADDQPKDGAILSVDHAFAIKSEREFTAARIAATTIARLDAASKVPGRLSVQLTPESVELAPGAGKVSLSKLKQRLWQASSFRLDIDGLDCTKVSRIESFTVQRAVSGKVDFPELEVTLSAASAATWAAWFDKFVVDGNKSDAFERNGTITFLLPNLKTMLATIELKGLGIFRLQTEPAGPNQVARVVAGLYCEQMSLHRDTP